MKETTVMYLRLSKEDEFIKDESNSIANQRKLLRGFIENDKQLRNTEVIEIRDDGYSGKNMERPGMSRLETMIRQKQVQHIVVKDFSRFSRDYLMLGKYVEQILPFMGITFVAVNDHYDSRDYCGGITSYDVALKSVLYDYYSEDLSVKVKSSLKMRRDSGKYIAAFAPYGYRKSKEDKHRLEIDPEVAAVVRRIFQEYADGRTMYAIADGLNQDGIDSPGKYIEKRDQKDYSGNRWDKSGWGNVAVRRILQNEVYLGTIVYDRLPETEVSQRATVTKEKDEWSRIADAHAPIVDQETFDRVQERIAKNQKPKQKHEPSILSGKVICKSCGYRMAFSHKGRPKFLCAHKYKLQSQEEKGQCADTVREEDLLALIGELLSEKLAGLDERRELMELEREKRNELVKAAYGKLNAMEHSLEKLKADQMAAYESYRDGRIDRETFLQQKKTFDEMIDRLKENMEKQEEACRKICADYVPTFGFDEAAGQISLQLVNRELVDALIERIIIGKNQEIHIVWKYQL